MISQYIKKRDHRTWDHNLPELQLAINSSEHEATGFSPAMANFGWDPLKPTEVILESEAHKLTYEETSSERFNRLTEIRNWLNLNLAKARYNQARYYNLRRKDWTPLVGSLVYKKEHHLSNAAESFAAKLAPKYKGPYEVLNFISPTVVELKDIELKSVVKCHISDLKPVKSSDP